MSSLRETLAVPTPASAVPNFGPVPDGIKDVATTEAERYHAFMVEHGEPESLPWDLLEIAFYSGFCKAFNYARAAFQRTAHPNPILAVCPNPACQAGIDSPELPQACPRCGAALTEGHA